MIYEVIQTITDGLNIFFKTRLRTLEDKAVISGILNQDGSVAQLEENKVLITLISVEKEPTTVGLKKDGKQRVHINFYVLFSCYFSNTNYSEALKFLDFTMNYLNDNSSIDIAESGLLKSTSSGGLKVQVELESLSLDQISHLWGAIGAKTMPSALYKIRMIPLDSNSLKEFRPSAAVLSRRTNQNGGGANNNSGFNPADANTPRTGGDTTNQNPTTKDEAPPANTSTAPPPSTPPPTETPKTTGKRPVILGGAFGGGSNDDDDDNEDNRDLPESPTGNNNPRENISNDFMSKPAADIDDDKDQVKEDNEKIEKSDEPDNEDDRDNRGNKDNKDNDVLSKLNPLKGNRGSSFSPFGLPNKPAQPNINAPDADINKGTQNNPNNDPNKNLNKGPDKI